MLPKNTDSDIQLNNSKSKLIKQQLSKLKKLYKENHHQYKKNKRINMILKLFVNVLNAVTVSSLVIGFSGAAPVLIVSLTASSLSSIISVVNDSVGFLGKAHQYQTTYLQTLDLFNTYNSKLLIKNSNLDEMLTEINNKLGLILDSAGPLVSISSDGSSI